MRCMAMRLQEAPTPPADEVERRFRSVLQSYDDAEALWCAPGCDPRRLGDRVCDEACRNGTNCAWRTLYGCVVVSNKQHTAAVECNFDNGDCTGCADGVGGDTYECVASYHTRVGNNLRYDECVSRCPWLGIGNGECEDRCLFSKVPTQNPACVARL